ARPDAAQPAPSQVDQLRKVALPKGTCRVRVAGFELAQPVGDGTGCGHWILLTVPPLRTDNCQNNSCARGSQNGKEAKADELRSPLRWRGVSGWFPVWLRYYRGLVRGAGKDKSKTLPAFLELPVPCVTHDPVDARGGAENLPNLLAGHSHLDFLAPVPQERG